MAEAGSSRSCVLRACMVRLSQAARIAGMAFSGQKQAALMQRTSPLRTGSRLAQSLTFPASCLRGGCISVECAGQGE